MGDPVTTGMMIGAAGGALTNSKNPLQGAMLGGAMGAAGGSFYGGASGVGAGTGGGFAGGGYGSIGTAPSIGEMASGGISQIGSDISGLGGWMNKNPLLTQAGMGLAQQAFAPEKPLPMAQPGQVSRGQIQPTDYMSLLNPQQQTVIRPATPSLI
jgi:hypothetical protein